MFVYSEKDIRKTINIIEKIIKRYNKKLTVDNIELRLLSKEILNTVYDIGGSFDESTIRAISEIKVKERYNIE